MNDDMRAVSESHCDDVSLRNTHSDERLPYHGNRGTYDGVRLQEVTNREFLEVIFRNATPDEFIWVTSFAGDPGHSNALWMGQGIPADRIGTTRLHHAENNFYAIGTIKPDDTGRRARRIAQASRVHVIVADDFGAKSEGDLKLPPSYVLETSPGSFHVGYLLAEPVDPDTGARLQKALAVQGLAGDPGADGPLRYVRLPVGRNTKKKHRTAANPHGFDHVLKEWHPERVYTAAELVEAFGLCLDGIGGAGRSRQADTGAGVPREVAERDPYLRAFRDLGLINGPLRSAGESGWWQDILCPWAHDEEHGHSPGEGFDSGSAYRIGGGFKCHHSHGEKFKFPEVKAWLHAEKSIETDAMDAELKHLLAPFDFDLIEEGELPEPGAEELERRARHGEEECILRERERIELEAQEKGTTAYDDTLRANLRAKLVHDGMAAEQVDEVGALIAKLVPHVRSTSSRWTVSKGDTAGSIEVSVALETLLKGAARTAGAPKATLETVLKDAGWAARTAGFEAARVHRENKPDLPFDVQAEEDLEGAPFDDPAPWPSSVDGGVLADQVADLLRTHVVFQDAVEADALALWLLGTYAMDQWRIWPKVLIQSPEKRCGKTTLLETASAVAHRAVVCSNVTASVLFRMIDLWHPSLVIDEADTFLKDDPELNGIINAGHTKRLAYVMRNVERDGEYRPTAFSVWGPQMIAGIGKQRGTLEDRSLCIRLRRRLPGDKVSPLPVGYYEANVDLRRKLKRWAKDSMGRLDPERVQDAVPVLGGNDRAKDNWVPLFAIAEALGGDWPVRAEVAYRAMNAGDADDQEISLLALRDVMAVFRALPNAQAVPTSTVRATLAGMDDRPWGSWGRGRRPIEAHRLGGMLRPYGIRTRDKKRNGRSIKHFFRDQVKDAYERYCGCWATDDPEMELVQVREHLDFEPPPDEDPAAD